MTRVTKQTVEMRETLVTKHLHIICDKCGAQLPINYGNETWDSYEFDLKAKWGTNYPEGGSGEQWEVHDLCKPCLAGLRQLLIDNGYSVVDSDWDW